MLDNRIDGIERAMAVAIGIDGRNGRLSEVTKRIDGYRGLLITLIIASASLVASVAAAWITMSERIARVEATQDLILRQLEKQK